MSDTCVPNIIVIGTAINQLETKVSIKTICCLRLFVIVYKHVKKKKSKVMVMMGNTCTLSLVVICTTINQL